MTRTRLPGRRPSMTMQFVYEANNYSVTLGFDVMVLRAGEAIGFDSSVPHLFKNLGTTPARGIWVVHHRHE